MNLSEPLGSYPSHEEFQVGRTIVVILIPEDGIRVNWLAKGKEVFYAREREIASVIQLAADFTRQYFGESLPAESHSFGSTLGLELRGVWVDPSDGSIDYDVYDPTDTLPSTPDDTAGDFAYSVDLALDTDGIIRVVPWITLDGG